jgi:hypothetical protein
MLVRVRVRARCYSSCSTSVTLSRSLASTSFVAVLLLFLRKNQFRNRSKHSADKLERLVFRVDCVESLLSTFQIGGGCFEHRSMIFRIHIVQTHAELRDMI